MRHPLFKEWKYQAFYSGFWLLALGSHWLFAYSFFDISMGLAFLDSVIASLCYYGLGLALWLALKYSPIEHLDWHSLLFNHLAAMILMVITWMTITYFSLLISSTRLEAFEVYFNASYAWRIMIGVIYYILIVLIYYAMKYYNNYQERIATENDAQRAAQEADLIRLRSQINPHFLFNSLNSISALTLDEPAKARVMIGQLSEILRSSLKDDRAMFSSLKEEMELICNYVDIEKVRFGDRLVFIEDIPADLMSDQLPSMILQPIVENAVKYGVSERLEPTNIAVRAFRDGRMLVVSINNELDADAVPSKGNQIGLKNVKQRLLGTYHRSDLFKITKNSTNFIVTIKFPQHGQETSESINHR